MMEVTSLDVVHEALARSDLLRERGRHVCPLCGKTALAVDEGRRRVLLYCHGDGCAEDDILRELNLDSDDLVLIEAETRVTHGHGRQQYGQVPWAFISGKASPWPSEQSSQPSALSPISIASPGPEPPRSPSAASAGPMCQKPLSHWKPRAGSGLPAPTSGSGSTGDS